MPIYEYHCPDCNFEFEKIRSMNEADHPIECEHCHGIHPERKLSVCYASSGGTSSVGSPSSGCGGCHGGSCGSCGR